MAGVNGWPPELDVTAWLAYGVARGWCSPPVCVMHDGTPMTPVEELELEEGSDPCMHIVRLWP